MSRLCENTMPFYIRDWSIGGFCYLQEVLEPTPCGCRGSTGPATWVFGDGYGGSGITAVLGMLVHYEEAKVEDMPQADVGSLAGCSKGKKI